MSVILEHFYDHPNSKKKVEEISHADQTFQQTYFHVIIIEQEIFLSTHIYDIYFLIYCFEASKVFVE